MSWDPAPAPEADKILEGKKALAEIRNIKGQRMELLAESKKLKARLHVIKQEMQALTAKRQKLMLQVQACGDLRRTAF